MTSVLLLNTLLLKASFNLRLEHVELRFPECHRVTTMCCVTATGWISVENAGKRVQWHTRPCRQLRVDLDRHKCRVCASAVILNMFPGVFYALLAGFLGAVASSSAKLSLGADYLKGVCETGLRTWGEQRKFRQADETTACDRVRHGRRQSE